MKRRVYWSVISARFAQVHVPFVQLCVQEESQVSDFSKIASVSQVHLIKTQNQCQCHRTEHQYFYTDSFQEISILSGM